MELKIKPLKKRDHKKAISFAISGMNFNLYISGKTMLKLYGRYFWYLELGRSSRVLAAYCGDELAGVLLADMRGEPVKKQSLWRKFYVGFINFIQKIFYKNGVNAYDSANTEMFARFSNEYKADGEICFLAANPDLKVKGVGTLLLSELERLENGKRIFLYTDSNCTFQFYEHRGFKRVGEKQITLAFSDKNKVPLSCYLYSKVCGDNN